MIHRDRVCLVRSFRYDDDEIDRLKKLTVKFTDLAIACLIFAQAFSQSLSYLNESDRELHSAVSVISARKNGKGADATDLAKELRISKHIAYRRLREAFEGGVIRRSDMSGMWNRKSYLPAKEVQILPNLEIIFRKLFPGQRCKFIHPITGKEVEYGPERKTKP